MDIGEIYFEIVLFVLGTAIGFITNYFSNKKNLKENQRIFEHRFGPQLLNILIGETNFKYKKLSEASSDAKETIGKYVANRWGIEGSTILLDAGTTTERVARYLSNINISDLIICTANPIAALHFMSRSRQNCFLFPGEIDENYAGTISNEELISSVVKFAETAAREKAGKFEVSRHKIGIIGALPIFPLTGPCSNDARTVHIKRTIINLSREIVVTVDISKFYEEREYKNDFHPVFDDKKEWEKLLRGEKDVGKKITIVTFQNKRDASELDRIRHLLIFAI